MKIEQLMGKERQAQYHLFMILYQAEGPPSVKDLTQALQLSKVTLLKYITNLNQLFDKHGVACQLIIENEKLITQETGLFSWTNWIWLLLQDSIPYQMLLHFFTHQHVNATKLSLDLMISEATFNRHLASINQCLEEFGIGISQGKQTGSELQWRYFYYELLEMTYSKEDRSSLTAEIDRSHLKHLTSHLTRQELEPEKLDKLSLFIAISQKRLAFQKESAEAEWPNGVYFQNNVFYNRLEKIMFHYLSRYAIEFDSFEAKCLFAFLQSYPILPLPTISYILGFGGPIADKVSEAIWLMRKANIVAYRTKEEIIYGLSLFFGKAYFFKGGLISGEKNLAFLADLVAPEEQVKIEVLMRHHMILLGDKALQETDLAKSLSYKMLELLLFAIERQTKPLKIGLCLGADSVERAILEVTIRKQLDNNRNFHFLPYQEKGDFDCIVCYQNREIQSDRPVYQLKYYGFSHDLKALELFLKELLLKKNKQEN
ncbi:helix-turn-helix domain-containing protein [Streptococcus hongkongensis]|nr:hypothetical protein NC01_03730 [Streptococcus uberis]